MGTNHELPSMIYWRSNQNWNREFQFQSRSSRLFNGKIGTPQRRTTTTNTLSALTHERDAQEYGRTQLRVCGMRSPNCCMRFGESALWPSTAGSPLTAMPTARIHSINNRGEPSETCSRLPRHDHCMRPIESRSLKLHARCLLPGNHNAGAQPMACKARTLIHRCVFMAMRNDLQS